MNQKTLVKNLMTGKDGKLFIDVNGVSEELLEIDTYSVKANYTNLDYQPVGSYQKFSVPADVSYTLTFTEAVVRDDLIMEPLLEAAKRSASHLEPAPTSRTERSRSLRSRTVFRMENLI